MSPIIIVLGYRLAIEPIFVAFIADRIFKLELCLHPFSSSLAQFDKSFINSSLFFFTNHHTTFKQGRPTRDKFASWLCFLLMFTSQYKTYSESSWHQTLILWSVLMSPSIKTETHLFFIRMRKLFWKNWALMIHSIQLQNAWTNARKRQFYNVFVFNWWGKTKQQTTEENVLREDGWESADCLYQSGVRLRLNALLKKNNLKRPHNTWNWKRSIFMLQVISCGFVPWESFTVSEFVVGLKMQAKLCHSNNYTFFSHKTWTTGTMF